MCATTTEARPAFARRCGRRALALCAAALLAGCGGGASVFIGVGPDDHPPRVVLAAGPPTVLPGQFVTLQADARDDYGVDYVAFYQLRIDGSAVRIGIVYGPPWVLSFALDPNTPDPAQFFARAVDGANQYGDSAAAVVRVLR